MKPLILLDFDGVLFNSAYEAFQVCQNTVQKNDRYRQGVSFDEFMTFRSHLTDAWQFSRLYQKDRLLKDVLKLNEIVPDEQDWAFSTQFFATRDEMLKDPNWAKLMSPYPFFYQLSPLLAKHADRFKVLSTRNTASIQRTFDFFDVSNIEIYGQEAIRQYGSKLNVAKHHGWLSQGDYVVYVDDMNAHLEPFEMEVDFCIHAGWGYDTNHLNSYTEDQAFQIIQGFLKLVYS